MNKILIPVVFAVCVGSAFAQSATVTTSDDKGKVEATTTVRSTVAEQDSADHFCLRETGSHVRVKPKGSHDRAVECANAPGRSYSRAEIDRSGATSTADALRRLDPSIH